MTYWVQTSVHCLFSLDLKVDGNEKLGGLRFLQLLGIGLFLNMPFANAKRISVSALSSKKNGRLIIN